MNDMYSNLEKIADLKAKGVISEDEFNRMKAQIMAEGDAKAKMIYWGTDEKNYCTLLHLAQFAGFMIPLAGMILPIAMWLIYKEQNTFIDQNGRNVVNWIISEVIYFIICIILCFVLVGFLLLAALGIVGIIFAVIGAIKASQGTAWKYPMTIRFM